MFHACATTADQGGRRWLGLQRMLAGGGGGGGGGGGSAQIACQPGVQGLALFSPVQGTVLASPMLTVRAARKAARAARAQPKGVAGTAVPSAARGQCAGVSGSVRGCGGSNGLMAGTFSAFACLQAAIVR